MCMYLIEVGYYNNCSNIALYIFIKGTVRFGKFISVKIIRSM